MAPSLPGAAAPRASGEEEALDVLLDLASLSRQMLSDADEDAEVYAMASKLAGAGPGGAEGGAGEA